MTPVRPAKTFELAALHFAVFCAALSPGSHSRADQAGPVVSSKTLDRTAEPRSKPHPPPGSDLTLSASGAVALDALTGDLLYAKNPEARLYPASTTKIMTALIVIESGALQNEVEITKPDSLVGESSLHLVPGEKISREQMLYGLLLKSANDVAHALGRENAGSVEAFALKMNTRARELGCASTHFMNPHGLHHPEHYTCPRDLGIIARAAMQQPLFRKIVSTRESSWSSAASGTQTLWNHNHLLETFPGCSGVKTGYTSHAQQVLVSAAVRDGREVIGVVMHSQTPEAWEDSERLLERALAPKPAAHRFESNSIDSP